MGNLQIENWELVKRIILANGTELPIIPGSLTWQEPNQYRFSKWSDISSNWVDHGCVLDSYVVAAIEREKR